MKTYNAKDYLAKYQELKFTTDTFLDSYIPGSERAISAIAGYNVIEVADQEIQIQQSPGFDLLVVKTDAGQGNCFHSHDEIEVFWVFHGKYKIVSGKDKRSNGNFVTLDQFDLIAVPGYSSRCFEGIESGSVLFQLTNARAQHVVWHPNVLEESRKTGIVYLKDHTLIDTNKGYNVPENAEIAELPVAADYDKYKVLSPEELESVTFRYKQAKWTEFYPGLDVCYVFGPKDAAYDFHVKTSCEINSFIFKLASNEKISLKNSEGAMAVVMTGELFITLDLEDGSHRIHLVPGDSLLIPANVSYHLELVKEAQFYLFVNTNYPKINFL